MNKQCPTFIFEGDCFSSYDVVCIERVGKDEVNIWLRGKNEPITFRQRSSEEQIRERDTAIALWLKSLEEAAA